MLGLHYSIAFLHSLPRSDPGPVYMDKAMLDQLRQNCANDYFVLLANEMPMN